MYTRSKTRTNLTPLIDVVFLLLLFFLLSSQLVPAKISSLNLGQTQSSGNQNMPYLIDLGEGIELNGRSISNEELLSKLISDPKAIAVRVDYGVNVQQLLGFINELRANGLKDILLIERASE